MYQRLFTLPATPQLTASERSALFWLVNGWSNAQIRRLTGLSRSTIANRVHDIFRKMNFRDRGAAVVWAWQAQENSTIIGDCNGKTTRE